jgi:hypothetical protein
MAATRVELAVGGQLAVMGACLHLALRVLPVARVAAMARAVSGSPLPLGHRRCDEPTLARLAAASARLFRDDGPCLLKTILFASLGLPGSRDDEVVIGVRRGDRGRIEAHAWVERDGLPFAEPGATPARFAPLTRL